MNRQDILQSIAEQLHGHLEHGDTQSQCSCQEVAALIVDGMISVQEFEGEAEQTYVTMQAGGTRGGASHKLTNVTVNMDKLAVVVGEAGLVVSHAVDAHWVVPFGVLLVWRSLADALTVPLSEREASILWTIYATRREQDKSVDEDGLLTGVNEERRIFGHPPISLQELGDGVTALIALRSIRRLDGSPTRLALQETIRVQFD